MFLDDIANYIQSNSSWVVGTTLFKALLPDQPDVCVVIFKTGGQAPDLASNIDYPAFQIRVRDTNFENGETNAMALQNLLHGVHETQIGGTYVNLLAAQQSPSSIGRDQDNRWEWTQNFYTIIRRS